MYVYGANLAAQSVRNLLAVKETQVRAVSREYPLEDEMATHPSILAWEIPWTEEFYGLQSMELQRVRHYLATIYIYIYIYIKQPYILYIYIYI